MAFRKWSSKATRRRDALRRVQFVGVLAVICGGSAIMIEEPDPLANVLTYLAAACVGVLTYGSTPGGAVLTTALAVAAYRVGLQITHASTSNSFTLAVVVLLSGAAAVAATAGAARSDNRLIRRSSSPNCVGYDVFTLILGRELAHAQRYGSIGTLSLLRLRNLDALVRPDAYHQHEMLISHIMATIAGNVRSSDIACYLGDLHFAIVFLYASADQAQIALDRLRAALAPLPEKRCPALSSGPLDWDSIQLEYPAAGTEVADLLDVAATALGANTQQHIATLEKERTLKQAHLQRLGYTG